MAYINDVAEDDPAEPEWANAIRDQGVATFSNTTERDGAITSPITGQLCSIAGAPMVYTGSTWLPIAVMGTFSGTTDASGFLTVTHSLGFTPTKVVVTSGNTSGPSFWGSAGVDMIGATTFRIRAVDGVTSAVKASTSISGYFSASA